MKKYIALMMTIILVFGIGTGCSNKNTKEKVDNRPYYEKLVTADLDSKKSQNTNITSIEQIVIEKDGGSYWIDNYKKAFKANKSVPAIIEAYKVSYKISYGKEYPAIGEVSGTVKKIYILIKDTDDETSQWKVAEDY